MRLQSIPKTDKVKRKKTRQQIESYVVEKRGWDSWDTREKETFFSCLRESGRNFDKISNKIETKTYDQVRYFYYRLLKKIDKLLAPQVLDRKDHILISNALLSFWEINKDTKLESNKDTAQLAQALKERMNSRYILKRCGMVIFSKISQRRNVDQHRDPVQPSQKGTTAPLPLTNLPPGKGRASKIVVTLTPRDQDTVKLLHNAKYTDMELKYLDLEIPFILLKN